MNTPKVPYEETAELAIIGCIFLDQNIIYQLGDTLKADDFYDSKNRLIYKAMLQLSKEGRGIDPTTVIGLLTTNNTLDQCGGIEYISSVASSSYSTMNIDSYVDLVANASLRRRAIAVLQDLSQAGYDTNVSEFDYL